MRGPSVASVTFASIAPLVAAASLLSLTACKKPPPGTPPGTRLLEWKRGPTSWSSGVSLGDDIGPAQVTTKDVTYTPGSKNGGGAGPGAGPAVFTVRVERGFTKMVPNAKGERPAEDASVPRTIDITARDAGKWRASATCEPEMSWPTAGTAPRAVQVIERCRIALKGPRDREAGIELTVFGEDRLGTMGTFGEATASP